MQPGTANRSLFLELTLNEDLEFLSLSLKGMPGSRPIDHTHDKFKQEHVNVFLLLALEPIADRSDSNDMTAWIATVRTEQWFDDSASAIMKRTGEPYKELFCLNHQTNRDLKDTFSRFDLQTEKDQKQAEKWPFRCVFLKRSPGVLIRPGTLTSPAIRVKIRDSASGSLQDASAVQIRDAIRSPESGVSHEIASSSIDEAFKLIDAHPARVYLKRPGAIRKMLGYTDSFLRSRDPVRVTMVQYSGMIAQPCYQAFLDLGWPVSLWIVDPDSALDQFDPDQIERIATTLGTSRKHAMDLAEKSLGSADDKMFSINLYPADVAGLQLIHVPGLFTEFGWYLRDRLQSHTAIDGHTAPAFVIDHSNAQCRDSCDKFVRTHIRRITAAIADESQSSSIS